MGGSSSTPSPGPNGSSTGPRRPRRSRRRARAAPGRGESEAIACYREVRGVARAGRTVMNTVSLQEAEARLGELVRGLAPGAEVVITLDQQPVARLVGIAPARRGCRPRPPVTGVPTAGLYEGRLRV